MPSLEQISVLLVWTAVAIYAVAFIFYTIDLARRSSQALDAKDAAVRERELVGVGAASRSLSERSETKRPTGAANRSIDSSRSPLAVPAGQRVRPVFARIGTSLTGWRSSSTWAVTSRAASRRDACRGPTCTSSP